MLASRRWPCWTPVPLENVEMSERIGGYTSYIILAHAHFSHDNPCVCSLDLPVYGELLFRQATGNATLLHPLLYVVDFKRLLGFDEAQDA
jgi:hypothetical protein